MTKDEFNKWFDEHLGDVHEDIILRIAYKYDFEEKYDFSNVYYYRDCDYPNLWVCEWDWWEGQDDIVVIDLVKMEDIFNVKFAVDKIQESVLNNIWCTDAIREIRNILKEYNDTVESFEEAK